MIIHVVKSGDTISAIARLYGVSPDRILSDNGLTPTSALVVGQALIITLPEEIHIVASGETVNSIAAEYGITVSELMQNNPWLSADPVLYTGEVLTIRFQGNKIRTITTLGYAYHFINLDVLLYALPFLTYLYIFSYGFTESGQLIPINDTELINLAYQFNVAPVMVFTTITETGTFSTERAKRLLNDPAYQTRVLDNIIITMREKGYLGLDIDFEYIAPEDAQAYLQFLRITHARLAANGFTMSVALAPKTHASQPGLLYEAHNYEEIGSIADSVFLMTYEWGYTYGPPMAVAPLPQVTSVVNYAVTAIPPDKINMGIPNYGYDWTLPYERGVSIAENVGNEEAVRIAAANNAIIEFDDSAKSPFFYYTKNRLAHIVWFEDVRSIQAKLQLADRNSLLGIGYWNIMRPFNQNFALISTKYTVRKVV